MSIYIKRRGKAMPGNHGCAALVSQQQFLLYNISSSRTFIAPLSFISETIFS